MVKTEGFIIIIYCKRLFMRRRKLVAAKCEAGRRRFKISALCIGGQFSAAISSSATAISEAAYCGDPKSVQF